MIRILFPAVAITMAMVSQVYSQAIVGSWSIRNAGEAKSDAVITFLTNGTYTMAEDGNSSLDPNGKDGMERGTYTWNPTTKALTTKTLVDTTRQWGLSHSDFKKASVSGNKLTLAASDGQFTLTRVTSRTNPIVGGWYIKSGGGGSCAVVTFLSDGAYFMVQDGKDGTGKTGVERGSYTWNPATGAFTRKLRVDTNGGFGFSDPAKRSVFVSRNKLTLKVQGEGEFVLSRVISSK